MKAMKRHDVRWRRLLAALLTMPLLMLAASAYSAPKNLLVLGDSLSAEYGLTRGSGVAHSGGASKAWGGTNWAATSAAGISGNKYFTLGLTVNAGHTESLSSIGLHYRRSSDGPASLLLQYQLNNGSWVTVSDTANLFTDTTTIGGNATVNLSSVAALQNLAGGTVVNFRFTPYGATTTTGTFYIYNQTGNDLTINGSYT